MKRETVEFGHEREEEREYWLLKRSSINYDCVQNLDGTSMLIRAQLIWIFSGQ